MGQTSMVTKQSDSPDIDSPDIDSPASGSTRRVVCVKNVAKQYQRAVALRDISLDVNRGEIFGLIGPDGSGKSSLIRAVAGVQQYDSGDITVFGQRIDSERSAEKVKSRIGLMPQGLGNNLYANLSIEENIDYFAGLRLVPRDALRSRKERLLGITRLDEFRDRPMKQLSGGMKQKLGLVCTLIHEPEFVLLDEPTTGVDPVSRRDFWAILSELVHHSKMTAIVSTAYMDEAAYMDRISLFMDGRIISQGTQEDVEALISGTIVSFQSDDSLAAVNQILPHLPHVQSLGDVVRVFVPEQRKEAALGSIVQVASIPRGELTMSPPDLEDAMATLLSKEIDGEDGARSSGPSLPQLKQQTGQRQPLGESGPPPIQARELVRDFGKFRAVDHVSFDVDKGRIFGLLGANGAGKTTVIKMLTGLLSPTSGHGSVAGAEIKKASQAIRERIGYMSQSFSLYLDMTALENLVFYAGVYGLFPSQQRDRIGHLLQTIGLEGYEERVTSDLPMGIRQRLALACALIHQPRVIFLDEPTSGVDVLGRRQFWEILVRLAREDGVAILVTTHYMLEAEHCDDLALMYAGRVIAKGTPSHLRDDLEQNVGTPLGMVTSSPLDALRIARQNGFDRAALFGRSLRVLTKDVAEKEQRLRDLFASMQISVSDVAHEPVTMEDVFVHSILSQEQRADAT